MIAHWGQYPKDEVGKERKRGEVMEEKEENEEEEEEGEGEKEGKITRESLWRWRYDCSRFSGDFGVRGGGIGGLEEG